MRLLTLVFLALAMLTSCTSDKDPFGKMNDFDQGPMLENLANNLIVPSYLGLRDQTKSLKEAIADYRSAPTVETLTAAREALNLQGWPGNNAALISWPSESNGLSGILKHLPGRHPQNQSECPKRGR